MKVGITCDLHYGFDNSTEHTLTRFLHGVSKEDIEVLIVAGDWATSDPADTKNLITLIRKVMPHLPVIGVWGNHDFWQHRAYYKNYKNPMDIEDLSIELDTFAERHGITIFNGYNNITIGDQYFTGWGGWYTMYTPLVNDPHWMPRYEEDLPIFDWMRRRANSQFSRMLQNLEFYQEENSRKPIVITHFTNPSLTTSPFYHFCGESIHFKYLEELEIKPVVVYGHSHIKKIEELNGILYLNSGSDYGLPRLLILDTETMGVKDVGFPNRNRFIEDERTDS